jgi:membrane protein
VAELRKRIKRWASKLNKRAHGWPGIINEAFGNALAPDSSITAAAIAYFALLSVFPLTLLSIAIAASSIGGFMDQRSIVQNLEFVTPALGQLLGENLDAIIEARGPASSIALVGLLWSASTIFYTLNQTMHKIWGDTRSRPVWKKRGLSLIFVLTFVGPFLFLASVASSTIAGLQALFPDALFSVGAGTGLAASLLLDIALFMVLYGLLPRGASTWRDILPGAIGAGLLWELAKKTFLVFVSGYISASNLIYGSAATIIAFLVWAYLSGLIFLFGAFLSVAYYKHRTKRKG